MSTLQNGVKSNFVQIVQDVCDSILYFVVIKTRCEIQSSHDSKSLTKKFLFFCFTKVFWWLKKMTIEKFWSQQRKIVRDILESRAVVFIIVETRDQN